MRMIFIFSFIGLLIACDTAKNSVNSDNTNLNQSKMDTIKIENEKLDYQIIIMEIGFDQWLSTQKPETYYTQSYLEIKNNFYVMEWNRRVLSPTYYNPNIYQQLIDYDHKNDYGLEVNYKLFMYFQFIQFKYKERL